MTDVAVVASREVIDATESRKWAPMAAAISDTGVLKDISTDSVADVIHLSYGRQLSHRAIGRQLEIDHRMVGKIVAASSELLRSGCVLISETELAPMS
jgi:hypothetical protein